MGQSKSLVTVASAGHFVTAMIQKLMRPCTAVATLLSQSAEAAFLRRGDPMPGSQCSLRSSLGQGSAASKLPGRPGLHLSPAFYTRGRVEEPPPKLWLNHSSSALWPLLLIESWKLCRWKVCEHGHFAARMSGAGQCPVVSGGSPRKDLWSSKYWYYLTKCQLWVLSHTWEEQPRSWPLWSTQPNRTFVVGILELIFFLSTGI